MTDADVVRVGFLTNAALLSGAVLIVALAWRDNAATVLVLLGIASTALCYAGQRLLEDHDSALATVATLAAFVGSWGFTLGALAMLLIRRFMS